MLRSSVIILSETKEPAQYVARSPREMLAFPLDFSPFGLTAKADASGVDLKVRTSDLKVHDAQHDTTYWAKLRCYHLIYCLNLSCNTIIVPLFRFQYNVRVKAKAVRV